VTIAVALRGRVSDAFALDVAFDVPSTGVTALLGPSGAGKTTVLRALAGFDRVAGTIAVDGAVWQDAVQFLPQHRRRVGYVAPTLGLLPHLSVGGNLAYAARRAPPGPFRRDDVIARTGIAALLDRSPARLSGGEGQRASIARALLGQPRLLLMDEPLANLDTAGRGQLLSAFADLLGGIAVPVVYVTHDAAEADRLADRAIHLRDGCVVVPPGFG
jgi:molybdate transport system ATP-binding protein